MSSLIVPKSEVILVGGGDTPPGLLDTCIGEQTIAGPFSGKDVRMMLSRPVLRELLAAAEQSRSKRCVLHGVGIKQKVWRGGDGNVYTTLTIVAQSPVPEGTVLDFIPE